MPKAADFAAFFIWAVPLKRIDPGGSAVRGPILKSMLVEELDLLLRFLLSSFLIRLFLSFLSQSIFS